MRDTTRPALPADQTPRAPLHKRLLWMAAIWTASVLSVGLVAGAIRLMLKP